MTNNSIKTSDYLSCNDQYWSNGYAAENVESFVFRPYGRILKYEFGLDGTHAERLLDFGCGQGAALQFFHSKGFDVHGVDISQTDIAHCRNLMPEIADQFRVVDADKPSPTDEFCGGSFDVITGIQSLYYYSDEDMANRLESLYHMMKPGGVIYATMIGEGHYLYDHSTEHKDGLRLVEFQSDRLSVDNYFINFTKSKEQLAERFHLWEKKHIGFYDAEYREGEGRSFHFTFVGQKR